MPESTSTSPAMLSQRAKLAAGQPISQLMAQALANPNLISLAAGFVDQASLPVETTQRAWGTLMGGGGPDSFAALQYGSTWGHPQLREFLLAEAREDTGCSHDLEQILITAGSNQFLHLVAESILNPGDIVLCAAPSYFVFLGTLSGIGAQAYGVETDEYGMIPESLAEAWETLRQRGEQDRVKAVYTVPYFDNPAGTTLPQARGEAIVELAKRWSSEEGRTIFVVADEAYRKLRYEGDDVPSMLRHDPEGENVISAGTFSKSYSPGVRVGWGLLPKPLVGPVFNQKGNIDFGSPNLSQSLMAEVLRSDLLEPHVETLRKTYAEKRDAMLAALQTHFGDMAGASWYEPQGGLYVWLRLPAHVNTGPDSQLIRASQESGVLYVPGRFCFPQAGAPVQDNTMRLSFGVQSPAKISEGIALLAKAVESVTN